MKIESADLHGKHLTESEDPFTVTDVLLSENLDCIVSNEIVHLTKDDLVLSNTKFRNWFIQQNKWLVVVHIASFIGVLSFAIGMIMIRIMVWC